MISEWRNQSFRSSIAVKVAFLNNPLKACPADGIQLHFLPIVRSNKDTARDQKLRIDF